MIKSDDNFEQDINDIGKLAIVPTMLEVICQTTGMGFSAVARVTNDRWISCSVRDDINFGLKPGSELEIKTTICNEIRDSKEPVIINHVSDSPEFRNHHTPAMYGFESYISVPIIRKDGSFFGTLCAIDPKPNILDTPAVMGMFTLFADLISFHLSIIEENRVTATKLEEEKAFKDILEKEVKQRTQELKDYNITLQKMNKDLQAFAYISSHDLQEPLRKIQTIATIITDKEADRLSEKGRDYFNRMKNAAERMQTLINDLLAYSRTSLAEGNFEEINLQAVLEEITADITDELKQINGFIVTTETCMARVIPFQFRQLLYNIIINSIKFSNPEKPLVINVKCNIESGKAIGYDKLDPNADYCHINITDNGIGFEPRYNERIFELFQRLNDKSKYKGTGIGLSIVKRIVENHNGFITAHGELNKGATFDIYLPYQ